MPSPPSFGGHLPQRGRRDLAFCKPLVSCLLGSPFGGAGTAAAVTERASCQRLAHSCPRAEDRKMALLGSNPHKTWVFEQCHMALFVEIALLLYFKLLKQTPSESRFLRFELCHFPLNCAMWHCSQSRINTGFFAVGCSRNQVITQFTDHALVHVVHSMI